MVVRWWRVFGAEAGDFPDQDCVFFGRAGDYKVAVEGDACGGGSRSIILRGQERRGHRRSCLPVDVVRVNFLRGKVWIMNSYCSAAAGVFVACQIGHNPLLVKG